MAAEAMQSTIEILLITHYALLRDSVGRLLAGGVGFNVAGQCASLHEALDVLNHEAVDVVLLDLDLGKHVSEEFVRTAMRRGFKGKVLLLAADINHDDVADWIRAGVCGIFHKRDSAALLEHGIRDVVAGNVWFKQKQLQDALHAAADPGSKAHNSGFTRREQSVLSLVSEGLTNKQIGLQIGVSEGSVKATVQQLFAKFGVRSRSRLVRIALEQQSLH